MPTPHISAQPDDFAPVVLMPGDPRRARRIAETFFTDARLVTEVRSIEGWTGTVDGRPVSVLASGMGMPSISIYATELFRFYGVRRIVRVGSAGAIATDLELGDVVIGSAAHTDSAIPAQWVPGVHLSLAPSYAMLAAAVHAAEQAGITHRVGAIFSSDTFYSDNAARTAALAAFGTLAVEMEAAALYGVAARERREALTVATVSDHLVTGAHLSSEERETTFAAMVQIALAALLDPPLSDLAHQG
jgi:purine-nucleoside phosphorylase